MSREIFIVHDDGEPVLCTMSPSKAYKKAKTLQCAITRMGIDSVPCSVVRYGYSNIEKFYTRYC